MPVAGDLQNLPLDIPTLTFAAVCVAGFLGLLLILTWLQQRDVAALAWWGSAYLIGAAAILLRGAPAPIFSIPTELAEAMIFIACGLVWNGVRLFQGRRRWPSAAVAGAVLWVILAQMPGMADGSAARVALGGIIVAVYTFFIAYELSRERRKSLYSRTAAVVVPCLYAAMFLMPLALHTLLPNSFAGNWLTVFVLEAIIYSVGTAFILLLMVKDRHVLFYRKAATTDFLTGLLNRGTFLGSAQKLKNDQCERGEPVTMLMFDLDHFKSVNDRFGHGTGDSVLKVFAEAARTSMRASDIIGRFGGEEFAAIVPEPMEGAVHIAERLRAAFETAGATVDNHAIGATVSIGLATTYLPDSTIDSLLLRADAALYRAKNEGRNRFLCADEEPGSEQARLASAARILRSNAETGRSQGVFKGRFVARRAKPSNLASQAATD